MSSHSRGSRWDDADSRFARTVTGLRTGSTQYSSSSARSFHSLRCSSCHLGTRSPKCELLQAEALGHDITAPAPHRQPGSDQIDPLTSETSFMTNLPVVSVSQAGRSSDGPALLAMLRAAGAWLEQNSDAVNALNVFPVPDGDTGTNMALTMRAALDVGERSAAGGAGAMAAAIARGALLGARGNSGVILSQILRGIADGLNGMESVTAADVAVALRSASDRAYQSMTQPQEGTLLTVVRRAAERAGAVVAPDMPLDRLIAESLAEARQALAETPSLLPVLREAGVVDAGGQGLVLLLEGALAFLENRDLGAAYESLGQIDTNWLQATAELHTEGQGEAWGYCTQFLIQGGNRSEQEVRTIFEAIGRSVLVAGDPTTLRVHLHTPDPGAALTLGIQMGTLDGIKIDNMEVQQTALLAATQANQPQIAIPVVAVAPGPGIGRVFHSLGAARVVSGGQSMNPSAQQLVQAVEAVAGDEVVLLPNNKNVVPVCQQVQQLTQKRVFVVPSHTVAQGVAALMALRPDDSVERNASAMTAAFEGVRSIEITRANRDAGLDGRAIRAGQSLGFLDRRLVANTGSPETALQQVLDTLESPFGYLLTIYYGDEVSAGEASALAAALRARPDEPEVEMVWGGQPLYPFLGSVES
ncbi:MAG: DAK2 domain-containing protein [Dehalococcoidia bacterium]|nr:DAK2 domain-containing protein [Dehalococcoidia bacterium]